MKTQLQLHKNVWLSVQSAQSAFSRRGFKSRYRQNCYTFSKNNYVTPATTQSTFINDIVNINKR